MGDKVLDLIVGFFIIWGVVLAVVGAIFVTGGFKPPYYDRIVDCRQQQPDTVIVSDGGKAHRMTVTVICK